MGECVNIPLVQKTNGEKNEMQLTTHNSQLTTRLVFYILFFLIFALISCKTAYSEPVVEEVSETEITSLDVKFVTAFGSKVTANLSWTDPSTSNFSGVKVTYENESKVKAIVDNGSTTVEPGAGKTSFHNLKSGTSYVFTVKVIDSDGNESQGVQKTVTAE